MPQDGNYKDERKLMCITARDTDIQLNLCIIAHMGAGIHSGAQTTGSNYYKKWQVGGR